MRNIEGKKKVEKNETPLPRCETKITSKPMKTKQKYNVNGSQHYSTSQHLTDIANYIQYLKYQLKQFMMNYYLHITLKIKAISICEPHKHSQRERERGT